MKTIIATTTEDKPIIAADRPIQVSLTQHTLGLVALTLGGAVVFAFLLDLIGLEVRLWTVGLAVAGLIILVGGNFWRQVRRGKYSWGGYDWGEFALFTAITVGILAYVLWLGRPNLLPVGTTVDAVHQYGLADYLRQSGRLPIHALDQQANLQDGLAYPPAFVVIVALLSEATGLDPIYLLYPVAALLVALASGISFAITSRLLDGKNGRLPLATLAAGLTLLPYGYTFGSITAQNYFAQVFGEMLLLLSLFFLVGWQRNDSPVSLGLFGLTVSALINCYPTFALLPIAAFGLITLLRNGYSWNKRLIYLFGLLIPIAIIFILFLKDRLATGLGTVSNEGEVLSPDLGRYGWPVIILAGLGLVVTLWRGPNLGRIVALYSGLLALEGVGLGLVKALFNQGSAYSIYKIFYPAVYLFAILAVLGLVWLLEVLSKNFRPVFTLAKGQSLRLFHFPKVIPALLSFLVFSLFLGATWLAYPQPERAYPVITADSLKVANWMKSNLKLGEFSVAYSLPQGTPAYWLQIGLFKQPRGVRSNDLLNKLPSTFESWFYVSDSNQYLFTDNLARANLDERVQVLYQSGNTAVLTRTAAYDDQLGLRPGLIIQYKSDLKLGYLEIRAEAAMSVEPSTWLELGLEIEPAGGGPPIFSAFVPSEKRRTKKQYLGMLVGVPDLKISEFYSNNTFPTPPPQKPRLAIGKYAAFMVLHKDSATVLRHKLFEFETIPDNYPKIDYSPGLAFGQFTFDGGLPSDHALSPIAPLDFRLAGDNLRLDGLEMPEKGTAGSAVQAVLQWQLSIPVSRSYQLGWAWLDEAGQLSAPVISQPLNGLYPTWLWSATQPNFVRQGLKLPAKPGRYQLAIVLLDQNDLAASPRPTGKFIEVT